MMNMTSQSESINELAGALAKAQGLIKHASKDTSNPFYKSRYATLDSVYNASRAALSENGLCVIQTTVVDDHGSVELVTMLCHASGQWIKSWYPVNPVKNDPQGLGSALTYARRYAYCAIIGVAAGDDDDGNAASGIDQSVEVIVGKTVFKNASLRNKFFSNVIDSFDRARDLKELEEIKSLNDEKLEQMRGGSEHDIIAYEEIKKQYKVYKARFADKETVEASFGSGFAETPTEEIPEPPENLWEQGAPVEKPVGNFKRKEQ